MPLRSLLRPYVALILLVAVSHLCAVAQDPPPTKSAPVPDAKPPEHPISEEQMRAFFEVCHTPTASRELTHEKLEAQRKQLPPWYPKPVWDEIESAIDNIDLAEVALPVYQKHISSQLADQLIQFLATRPGQDAVRVVIEKMVQAQHAGATVSESHEIAEEYIQRDRNLSRSKILSEMTPEQRKKAESLGSVYLRMQLEFAQINKEYSQAVVAKQTELVKAIVLKHQTEIAQAKEEYETNHR